MPKEVIYSDSKPYVVSPDGGEHPAGEPDLELPEGTGTAVYRRGVHVGWSRNRYVEVGVAQMNISTEWVETGHFTSLDRDGINRLIRSLRKARDAAYGSDA